MILSTRRIYLLCAVSLCLILFVAPASAFNWTVQHSSYDYPEGKLFGSCTVSFFDTDQKNYTVTLQSGQSYTWTSSNNGKTPLFYVKGYCMYYPGGYTGPGNPPRPQVLQSRRCDGTDWDGWFPFPDSPCSTQEIRLKICPKKGNNVWGFCPQ